MNDRCGPRLLPLRVLARDRPKIPALVQALTGNFSEHHGFLCRMHLTRIDELSATIEELSARRIDQADAPFRPAD